MPRTSSSVGAAACPAPFHCGPVPPRSPRNTPSASPPNPHPVVVVAPVALAAEPSAAAFALPAPLPPGPFDPCAAAINSSSFFGSLSHSLTCSCSPPSEAEASCAAMLDSLSRESVATKQISLMRIPCAPARADFSCNASSAGLDLPVGKARANRPISSSVTLEKNWMLASPAAESNCANCFSAGDPSSGTPSSKSCEFVAPSNRPASVPRGMAVRSSCHAIWSCSIVRACS